MCRIYALTHVTALVDITFMAVEPVGYFICPLRHESVSICNMANRSKIITSCTSNYEGKLTVLEIQICFLLEKNP